MVAARIALLSEKRATFEKSQLGLGAANVSDEQMHRRSIPTMAVRGTFC